jgi:hypothetical protein
VAFVPGAKQLVQHPMLFNANKHPENFPWTPQLQAIPENHLL